ncbi:hypothetical protein D9758_006236 [Tetrapyrgos nigripes]|uniref:Hydrophobin n=1 Tax=Tetrapyrgos nigripes TaxID=182062 RepID=A0A8H5GAM8_9AGAR|nr:hypothetical protein D9758_006236 [Tetrapyrgos nigripes]
MQFKFITVAALATLAAATPLSIRPGYPQHPQHPNDLVSGLLGLLGIVVGDITASIGLTCSPITVGVAGNSCTAQPVCCENNSFNGVVALGCTPININL